MLGFKHESLTFGEDHGTVTLEIFMIGPCDDPITVVWKTVSGTAKDGIHYNSNGGGKVVFDAQVRGTAKTCCMGLIFSRQA